MLTQQKSLVFVEDNSNQSTSIFAFAQLLYSLNNLQSLAYVNLSIQNHEHISLLEQLFLRTQMKKDYSYIHIDYYLKYANESLTRGILAQSEFQNLHIDHLKEIIKKNSYQVLVFDKLTIESPFLDKILELLKEIDWIQVLIIGDKSVKKYFKKYITEDFKLTHKSKQNDLTKYTLQDFSEVNTILAPHFFSSWLIIAYNFYLLKYSFTKRFFFTSNQESHLKEIFFISLLKKHLKPLLEFGRWDFVTASHSNLNITSLEDVKLFEGLLSQSFKITGVSNILFNSTNSLEIDLSKEFQNKLIEQKNVSLILTNKSVEFSNNQINVQNLISIK